MGALPCTPQFILPLVYQTFGIRRFFCSSFLFTSAFLFQMTLFCSTNSVSSPSPRSSSSFRSMLDCTVLALSTGNFPTYKTWPFFFKGNTHRGKHFRNSSAWIHLHHFYSDAQGMPRDLGGTISPHKSCAAPFPRWPNLTARPPQGGGLWCFAGGSISGQTPRCYHICPLHPRVAEAPSRGTSLAGAMPLPALLAVSHLIHLQPLTRENRARKQMICRSLQAQRPWERKGD